AACREVGLLGLAQVRYPALHAACASVVVRPGNASSMACSTRARWSASIVPCPACWRASASSRSASPVSTASLIDGPRVLGVERDDLAVNDLAGRGERGVLQFLHALAE